jgi:hypothetical protein
VHAQVLKVELHSAAAAAMSRVSCTSESVSAVGVGGMNKIKTYHVGADTGGDGGRVAT